MKRFRLSLLGGLLLPMTYVGLIYVVTLLVVLCGGGIHGDSWWAWLLSLPIEWSGLIYNWLFPPTAEKVFGLLRPAVILTEMITSFIVAALLTYGFLWRRDKTIKLR